MGERTCRCGALFNDTTADLIAHVTSPEHAQRMADLGVLQHTHSWLWVDARGTPVDEGYPNAIRYVKPGCPLCERQSREEHG